MKIAGLIHTPGCWQEDHVFGFLGCGGGQFVVSNFLCFSLIAKFYFNVFSCWIWLPTTSECKIEANTYDLVLGVGVLVCQFISHKQFLKLCRMSFFPHHQSQHVLRRPLQVFWFRLAFAHNVFVTLDSGCFLRRTIEFYHSVQGHAIRLFFHCQFSLRNNILSCLCHKDPPNLQENLSGLSSSSMPDSKAAGFLFDLCHVKPVFATQSNDCVLWVSMYFEINVIIRHSCPHISWAAFASCIQDPNAKGCKDMGPAERSADVRPKPAMSWKQWNELWETAAVLLWCCIVLHWSFFVAAERMLQHCISCVILCKLTVFVVCLSFTLFVFSTKWCLYIHKYAL